MNNLQRDPGFLSSEDKSASKLHTGMYKVTILPYRMGKLLYAGDMSVALRELQKVPTYEVRVRESVSDAARFLEGSDPVESVEIVDDTLRVVLKEEQQCEGLIAKLLVEHGYTLLYLSRKTMRLEDAFLSITEGKVQ